MFPALRWILQVSSIVNDPCQFHAICLSPYGVNTVEMNGSRTHAEGKRNAKPVFPLV